MIDVWKFLYLASFIHQAGNRHPPKQLEYRTVDEFNKEAVSGQPQTLDLSRESIFVPILESTMPLRLRRLGRQWYPRPVGWPWWFLPQLVLCRHMYPLASPFLDVLPVSTGMEDLGLKHFLVHR